MKYALDTNLYIRSIRDATFRTELQAFQARHAPALHLSSVVLHEMMVGASTPAHVREIRDSFTRFLSLPKRIVTPTHAAWSRAGEVLSEIASTVGMERSRMPRAFVNDALIAVSCSEAGVMLLTDNVQDFERLKPFVPFQFSQPWPPAVRR
ncbi:MAG TPA: type II toxin-antitoxin system VapC family toxin [Longimicrobium sp.]